MAALKVMQLQVREITTTLSAGQHSLQSEIQALSTRMPAMQMKTDTSTTMPNNNINLIAG